jgi:hypothetical protein
MTITFEALDAKQGDALLLHFEHDGDPVLWVVDGGPSGVYLNSLLPRLQEIREERALADDEPLPIDLVVVSHIDGDHILGVTDLFQALADAKDHHDPPPYDVGRVWHNAFERLVDEPTAHGVPASLDHVAHPAERGAAMIESARQGSRLADLIRLAQRAGNPPYDGLVVAPRELTTGFGGATVTVVAPTKAQLVALADQWEKELKAAVDRGDLAKIESYADNTASNLSSIVLHVAIDGKTLLLAGDARGDHVLEGLEAAGLMDPGGALHVDLLKVPHHGSDRNLECDFFERVTADHYVISSNGKDANPSTATLEWIVETQGDRPYAIHLTHRDANGAKATLDAARAPSNTFTVDWGRPDAALVSISL